MTTGSRPRMATPTRTLYGCGGQCSSSSSKSSSVSKTGCVVFPGCPDLFGRLLELARAEREQGEIAVGACARRVGQKDKAVGGVEKSPPVRPQKQRGLGLNPGRQAREVSGDRRGAAATPLASACISPSSAVLRTAGVRCVAHT